jgi:hypothetical protein
VALSAARAILPITMRGPDLLLAHLESLARLVDEQPEPVPRPSARERLEQELGLELARDLVASLSPPAPERP